MENLIQLLAWATAGSPALWPPEKHRENGTKPATIHPDTAIFEVWVESPGTGWYQMCEEWGFPGYDGVHDAFAIELESCWLSWDESCNSLSARLSS